MKVKELISLLKDTKISIDIETPFLEREQATIQETVWCDEFERLNNNELNDLEIKSIKYLRFEKSANKENRLAITVVRQSAFVLGLKIKEWPL